MSPPPAAAAPATVDIALPPMTAPQMAILQLDTVAERCIDVEGSPRSAKSWGIGFWIWKLAYQYHGIQVFYCRYKDESLIQLRDIWSKISAWFPEYLHPQWNSADQAWDFPNGQMVGEVFTGSRVFLSSLKSTELESLHSKYKGKTLAVVIIEEANEVPKANYLGLKERMSQSRTPLGEPYAYPLKIVLVHNCVDVDHWIAQEFPLAEDETTCRVEGHRHIRADLASNAANLGPMVMAGYEHDYPPGHTLRRTVIEGKRGVTLIGTPVYSGRFTRSTHVSLLPLAFNPSYPLLEGWDFGQEKPAVVWMQYLRHLAAIRILGAVKGREVFLEQFAPKVLEIRQRLFPQASEFRIWCDPSGAVGNGGMAYTPVTMLQQLGVPARPAKDPDSSRNANDAEVRNRAIQVLGAHMGRVALDGTPALLMAAGSVEVAHGPDGHLHEQPSQVLATAFEAGYIWDTHAPSDAHPNVRKPKKGTRYDDLMNALEYVVLGEGIPLAPSVLDISSAQASYQTAEQRMSLQRAIAARTALRNAQKDTHPVDSRVTLARPMGGHRRSFY